MAGFTDPILGSGGTLIREAIQSPNFDGPAGVAGWALLKTGDAYLNSLTARAAIVGGHLDIGGDDATSFHVDSGGGIWSGASVANKATAPFRVSNAGALVATSATITGALTGGTIDIGGDDATSFHVDSDGYMWIGAAAADKLIAPLAIAADGRLSAFDAGTGATVELDATGTGAVMLFGSGGPNLTARAQLYASTVLADTIEYLTIGGPETVDGGQPIIGLASDTTNNINYVQVLSDFFTLLDTTVLEVNDGSVSSPGIRFRTDTNTGIYQSADNTLDIAANGVRIAAFYDDGQVDFRYGTLYSGIGGTHFMSFYYDGVNVRGIVKNAGGATVVDRILG